MDKEVENILRSSILDTKIDQVIPREDLLEVVLAVQGDAIYALTDNQLTSYIFVLSQYQLFLQVQANVKYIKFIEAKRTFDLKMSREVSKNKEKATIKEKEANALSSSEELQGFEKAMVVRQADYLLFEKVPESVAEIANALKKELGLRAPQAGVNRSTYGR